MKLIKALTIKKALRYFDPQRPLWVDKERDAFYVYREGSHLDEMQRILLDSPEYPKILFSGPPGCGKSTELAKLSELLKKKFHILHLSAKQMTNNFFIPPEVLVYHILKCIGEYASQKKMKVFQEKIDPLVKRFQGWETKEADIDVGKKKVDFTTFEKYEKGETSIKGPVKLVSKTFAKPSPNEMIAAIGAAAKEFEKRKFFFFGGKKILLLVADMDKLEYQSAQDIFIKNFLNLTKMDCCAVFTFPLELKYDKDFVKTYRYFSGLYFLENFDFYTKNTAYNEHSKMQIRKVAEKRIRSSLLYSDVWEKVIEMCGGNLFELINIIRHCCVISLREKINYVDIELLDEALERIRLNYRIGLSAEDKAFLTKLDNDNKKGVMAKFPDKAILTKLLNHYCITEYRREKELDYKVNPILLQIVEEEQERIEAEKTEMKKKETEEKTNKYHDDFDEE